MSKWYEVFHPALEPFIGSVQVATQEDAVCLRNAIQTAMHANGTPCNGWDVRPVGVNERPRPKHADVPTNVTVEELLQAIAKHGQDVGILITWNQTNGQATVITAGNSPDHSQMAFETGQKVAQALDMVPEGAPLTEDRRDEHASS